MKIPLKVSQNLAAKCTAGVMVLSSLVLVGNSFIPRAAQSVMADSYDNQIKALQQQNASTQSSLNGLLSQASSYQDAINQLQSQINAVQSSINDNEAQQTATQQQITADQAQIDQERAYLASDIKAMYVDGTPSTLEVLATSKNLSDFVDKQEYRTSVQNKLQTTMQQIAALQSQLQDKKLKLNQLLDDMQTQKSQLDSDESQQATLLSYNQSQQDTLNSQISANNAQIASLRAQQAAALAAATGSGGNSAVGSSIVFHNMSAAQNCGGGYEYCSSALDDWVNDPWGLHYARECVHYVADELSLRGYYIPYNLFVGHGNAYQWVGVATSSGAAQLVSDPQPGDVVYMPIGSLGHVAIVDSVNADGSLHVSQMNWYPGLYSTMDLVKTSNLKYLRFNRQ